MSCSTSPRTHPCHARVSDPVTCYDVNVTGTLNVLLAARDAGCRRVVFASSSAVYGDDPALPKREIDAPEADLTLRFVETRR